MTTEVSDTIISRIQKLMRLSDSPVAGEAAAAAAKVQELLFAHNVEMSEVLSRDVEGKEIPAVAQKVFFPAGNYSREWRTQIASVVGRGHYCKLVILQGFRTTYGYAFVGRKHNLEAAVVVTQWVIDELIKMCDKSAKLHGARRTNWKFRQSFYLGAIHELNDRIEEQLDAQKVGESTSTALVLFNDKAVQAKFNEEFPHTGQARRSNLSSGHGGAYGDGREAGRNMNWNGAIKDGSSGSSLPALN